MWQAECSAWEIYWPFLTEGICGLAQRPDMQGIHSYPWSESECLLHFPELSLPVRDKDVPYYCSEQIFRQRHIDDNDTIHFGVSLSLTEAFLAHGKLMGGGL